MFYQMQSRSVLVLTASSAFVLGFVLIYVSVRVLQHNNPVLIAGGACVGLGLILIAVSGCCGGSKKESSSAPPRQAAARTSAAHQKTETPEQVAARRMAGLQKLRDLELGRM
ncbi:g3455 [Coccomyxa elongata]